MNLLAFSGFLTALVRTPAKNTFPSEMLHPYLFFAKSSFNTNVAIGKRRL